MRLGGVSVPVSAPTKKECIYQAQLIKAEYKANKRQITRATMTLKQAVGKYISARKSVLSPATIRCYQWIEENAFPAARDRALSAIRNWQEIIDAESRRYSPKTVKTSWTLVVSVLRENGIQPPKVKLPQIVPKEHPFLDPDQIKLFIKAVHGESCEIAALLGLHSLRRAEILGLTWDNIDLKTMVIHVRGTLVVGEENKPVQRNTTKTKASRRDVPIMIPELETALKAVSETERVGIVVKKHPALLWQQINRVCERNGLPLVGVHGLRHSFCSLAFSSEVNMTEREVMEIGGWDDPQTVRRIYEHISKKSLEKASAKMQRFYKNANKKTNESKKT